MEERRKHRRYEVAVDAIVSHDGKMGKVKDISLGGLRCRCIGNRRPGLGACDFDIYCAVNGFKLTMRKIPSLIIAEHLNRDESCPTNSLRLCSVMFEQLTPEQEGQLQGFIAAQHQHPS